jgi:hypothetical protein
MASHYDCPKRQASLPFLSELFLCKWDLVLTTWRDKFLGCGVAQQRLPRSPTTEIHESIGNPSKKPPQGGPEGLYYWASGYGRDIIGGGTSACQHMFNSIPPYNWKTSTHTHYIADMELHLNHYCKEIPHTNLNQIYWDTNTIIDDIEHLCYDGEIKFLQSWVKTKKTLCASICERPQTRWSKRPPS